VALAQDSAVLDQLNAIIGLVIGLLTICVILGGWVIWLHSRFASMDKRLALIERVDVSDDVQDLKDELEWVARILLVLVDREGVDVRHIKRPERKR
jgi:uncharacterized iron-regulated membrane protein